MNRLEQAEELLRWWEATNPPDDHQTALARDTRAFLRGESVEPPPVGQLLEEEGPK